MVAPQCQVVKLLVMSPATPLLQPPATPLLAQYQNPPFLLLVVLELLLQVSSEMPLKGESED